MKGRVYLYFGETAPNGGAKLTLGSFADIEKLGVIPTEGMRLGFYDFDADDENRPTYLCADGVLHFDEQSRTWAAFVDPDSFRSLYGPKLTSSLMA